MLRLASHMPLGASPSLSQGPGLRASVTDQRPTVSYCSRERADSPHPLSPACTGGELTLMACLQWAYRKRNKKASHPEQNTQQHSLQVARPGVQAALKKLGSWDPEQPEDPESGKNAAVGAPAGPAPGLQA